MRAVLVGKRSVAMTSPLVRKLTDRAEVLRYLNRRRAYCATAIQHLEPGLFESSRWLVAEGNGGFALCLFSRSWADYILTLGDEAALALLLDSGPVPGKAFITCEVDHLGVITGHYELKTRQTMLRMVTDRRAFAPVGGEAVWLRPGQIQELNRLHQPYSGTVFLPGQIRRGLYYGVWRDGQLVSVAGTHFISSSYGIAYVGNVLTHPQYRSQGLAAICTSAVTQELLKVCTEVVLSVEPENLPAVRVYSRLGYREDCLLVEASGRRKRHLGIALVGLWQRLSKGGHNYDNGR